MSYTSRFELYSLLGILPVIVPVTRRAEQAMIDEEYLTQADSSPHGHPWHTSFHASRFPGSERSCPRAAMYEMMDLPRERPSPFLVSVANAGKDIELRFIAKWEHAGILLSTNQNEEAEAVQMGFEDPETWLSTSFDSIVNPPGWNRPIPIEVKTKSQERIGQFRSGERMPDEKHIYQVKVETAFLHLRGREVWPDLKPCMGGVLLYISRDDPSQYVEFYFPLDMKFFNEGRKKLEEWKQFFLRGELPPHPFNGKDWSKPPCQYCDFKKHVCKPDHQSSVRLLAESHGIAFAQEIRPQYDYETKRAEVLGRWKEEDVATTTPPPAVPRRKQKRQEGSRRGNR